MEPLIDSLNEKKIIITGGGGYLGSHLAQKLAGFDTTIFLFDIKFNEISRKLSEQHSNIKLVDIDITDKQNLRKISLKIVPDYIFHFAALLNRERDFSIYSLLYEVNVKGTLNLLLVLNDIPYKGFFFSSTGEIYGTNNIPPFNEIQLPAPVSPYSLSKTMAEHLVKTYSELNNKTYTILRIFNYYGPNMPENFFISQMLSSFMQNKIFEMTGGSQKRDFLYIDDLIYAILNIINYENNKNETFNICSGKSIMLKELALIISSKLKKEHLLKIGALPYRTNEIWDLVGNNQKLNNINDDIVAVSIDEGINRIIINERI
jgi:nucleoside-diphosphate-sugar epimerase